MGNKYNDSEQESVTKSWAGERAKLAQMTGKEKADYIFTYYKIHIIVIIALIIAISWFIHHAMTYVDYEFFGMVINGESVNEEREQEITEYLGINMVDTTFNDASFQIPASWMKYDATSTQQDYGLNSDGTAQVSIYYVDKSNFNSRSDTKNMEIILESFTEGLEVTDTTDVKPVRISAPSRV